VKARFIGIGAIASLLSVAFGAFGAHGLKGLLSDSMMRNYETGVQYQMFHSLGLILIGMLILLWDKDSRSSAWLNRAGWLLLAGIVLFSGSLYTMALTGKTWLGAITPIGGVSFIAGWAVLTATAWRTGRTH
jgi:uncharacterized membrane protein YgdD (TMEM256/DUF423 family)